MNLTKQICHKAAHFDAVAFDVFDTLIKRDVAVPTGLFRLMGDDFYAARIRAEREARAAQSREVTLAEIYARPCLARYDAAAECAAELAACAANKPVLDAVQTLKKQGKKLYYISDMYLPQTQIDAMLRRCGYPCFDGGFVSCTYGVQKRSGRLFKRFLQETGLTAKQLLFIGDSWRADVAGAALAGITAWHLPTPPAPADNAAAFVENRLPQQRSDGEALGFSVLGPLAAAFCQWLHARRAARPEARLYFLARDMYLMRDVYHTLYPQEETGYLQVSRRSLAPAFLAAGDWATVLAALPRQTLTGAQIAEYCGTTCPPELADRQFDLKQPDREALHAFLRQLPRPDAADAATAYLSAQGIRSGDFLVDIGSGGTTQLLLERLLQFPLHGLQLSADDRLRTRFEWGLLADIQPPDYETRMAILRKKEELEGYNIDNEIIKYIATNVKSNIRELEGALTKIVASSKLNNKEINLELAEEALKDLISPNAAREVTPQLIINVVSEHFGITPLDLIGQKRSKELVFPRQIVMYLCGDMTSESLQNIGKALGGRDHTTIIHGTKKIASELKTDENLKNTIDILKKKINPQ